MRLDGASFDRSMSFLSAIPVLRPPSVSDARRRLSEWMAANLRGEPDAWELIHRDAASTGVRRGAVLGGLLALIGLLLLLTWGAWPDLIIDFGRELYVAWRIAEGETLYRDLAYFNGPLSPYVNGAVFALCGSSLTTLVICNVAVLSAVTGLLLRLVARYVSLSAAAIALVCFLLLFGFGHTYAIGNFNFITPYSHEMTHGLLLLLLQLTCISGPAGWRPRRWGVAGVLGGLLLLGKPELLVAGGVMLGMSMGLHRAAGRASWSAVAGCAAAAAAGAIVPVAAFAWLLKAQQPAAEWSVIGRQLLAPWFWIAGSNVTQLRFYQHITGFIDPVGNIARAVADLAGGAAIAVGLRGASRTATGRSAWSSIAWIAVGVGLLGFRFPLVLRNVFVVSGLLAAGLAWTAIRFRRTAFEQHHALACAAALAAALLLKICLHPRIDDYGFVLAAPAVTLGVALAVHWLPLWGASPAARPLVRLALLLLIGLDTTIVFGTSYARMSLKSVPVRGVRDGWRAYPTQGDAVQGALDWIAAHGADNTRLLVLPEGVSLNFLAQGRPPDRMSISCRRRSRCSASRGFWSRGSDRPPTWCCWSIDRWESTVSTPSVKQATGNNCSLGSTRIIARQ